MPACARAPTGPISQRCDIIIMVQFFRSGQHDDRRRRVLTEEVIGAAQAGSAKPSGGSRRATSRSYGPAAQRDRQPPLVDFVPQNLVKVALLLTLGLAFVAGLEAIYAVPARLVAADGTRLPAFDLAAEGSIANWFASTTLLFAALVAWVAYSVRRHRLDDYHGRYRIWLWSGACWLLLSVDKAARLHESWQAWAAQLSGRDLAAHGGLAWVAGYALIVGAVALRLVFEMRACRSSTAALVASGVAFAAAVVTHFQWLPGVSDVQRIMVEQGCEMVGGLLLLLSMCLHVRYVMLDAEGLLTRKAKAAADTAGEQKRGWGRRTKIDPAHDSVRAPARRSDLDPVDRDRDDDDRDALDEDEDDDEDDVQGERSAGGGPHDVHKLSKAERKALRREHQRQRKARLG